MRCGDLHLQIRDILETSVCFNGHTKNANLQTVLAIRNTKRGEKQVILSTIICQATEVLPQAGGTTVPISEFLQNFTGQKFWIKIFL